MKKKILIVLAVVLTLTLSLPSVAFAWYGWHSKTLEPMVHYNSATQYWCGPCSGTSIGQYYKTRDRNGDGIGDYRFLPSTEAEMYDALHEYMDTLSSGYTNWNNYGPGFVEMALHYGYDNFSYDYYATVSNDDGDGDGWPDDYRDIYDAINNGWPVALAAVQALEGFDGVEALPESSEQTHVGSPWPCTKWHWIAIKGYKFYEYGSLSDIRYLRIICTDSYSGTDDLVLSWDQLIAEVGEDYLRMVIIKDVDTPDTYGPVVEDFEWGIDGVSLEDWQSNGGEVDWYVYTYGDSVVEIDTAEAHTGTGSARIYRSSNLVYARYSLWQPSYIGFWVKKDDTADADFINGDGSNVIKVMINSEEELQYYDTSWHHVFWLRPNTWYLIEFRNIDWEARTYDIYVNGYCPPAGKGAGMRSYSLFEGQICYGSWSGSGTFWIDDINDILKAYATTVELLPATGENHVGTFHDLTATVYDKFGYGMEGVDVTWSISGVGSFWWTPGGVTDANGQADALITSSLPGTSTVTCEVTGNPSVYDTSTKDWTYTPEATTVELLPETGESPVDTSHDLTATVYDQFGYKMEGVDVTWSISGVGSFSGTPESQTDAAGQADAVITSSLPGTSTVRCEVAGSPLLYDTATNDWTYTPEATTLELLPETDSNPVDTSHDLTATVYDQFGYEMQGIAVTWSISGVGSFSGTPEGVTDVDGQADAVITSSFPGTSTVRCKVTGNPLVSGTATNNWTYTPEVTQLELLPETGENPVDTTHNLTATVYDQFGYVMEGVAVTWNISGVGSFSGTPESQTDVDGEADAVITSSVLGASTVGCEVTGNPSVYDTATKDWTYLEDFEWGNDGDSLSMDGGNIDWTVETDGSSVAEISTAQANSGTRSGRFYYDGSSDNILAYYSQDSLTWRGFYLRKDKDAVPYTITGDGTNTVFIKVDKKWLQYYDGSWQSVCKISEDTWHFIEFRNIDWVAATYDIYVDGNLENSDTPMSASTSYNGITAYYGSHYESEFWIDDILK